MEHTLLKQIKQELDNFIFLQQNTIVNIDNIVKGLKTMDNTFFIENTKLSETIQSMQLNMRTSYHDIQRSHKIIHEYENNICIHNWVHDDIEMGNENETHIVYCDKCGISKINPTYQMH